MGGAGIGQFGMSQVAGKLISNLGWRSALRYLALINFVALVLISFVIKRRLPRSHHLFNMKNEAEFLQNHNFLKLTFGYTFFIFGMMVPFTFLVIYSQKHGVSVSNSVLLFSLMGITSGTGRVIFGEIADLSIGRLPLLRVSMILAGVAALCWIACTDFQSILAFGLLYSFVAGGSISIVPSAAADIFGVKKISSFLGLLFTIGSFGNLLASPIAGFLADNYDSYTPAIILSGCCQMLGSVLLMTMVKEEGASRDPSPETSRKSLTSLDSRASSSRVSNPRVITGGEDEEEVLVSEEEVAIELANLHRDQSAQRQEQSQDVSPIEQQEKKEDDVV
jgi:predicted MFS family arabinose efflux permease